MHFFNGTEEALNTERLKERSFICDVFFYVEAILRVAVRLRGFPSTNLSGSLINREVDYWAACLRECACVGIQKVVEIAVSVCLNV